MFHFLLLKKVFYFGLIFCFSFASFLFFSEAKKELYVLCHKKKQGEKWVRVIRTKILTSKEREKDKTDKKCQTIYTKKGQDKVVGSGKYYETCNQFLRNIQKNLENVNWTCEKKSEIQIWNLEVSKPKSSLLFFLALQDQEKRFKNYPGGVDEEDLKVQKFLTEPPQSVFRKKVIEQIYRQRQAHLKKKKSPNEK